MAEILETSIPPVNKSSAGGPVQFEDTSGVGNRRSVQIERLLGGFGRRELNEAIAGVAVGRSVVVSLGTPRESKRETGRARPTILHSLEL